jgi:hypothetical protein
MNKPRKDNELISVILIIGIFTAVLLAVYFTYSNLAAILEGSFWLAGIWLILNAAIIAGWYIVIKYWQDPNKNLFRVLLVIVHILTIALTMGHRAGWLEQVK